MCTLDTNGFNSYQNFIIRYGFRQCVQLYRQSTARKVYYASLCDIYLLYLSLSQSHPDNAVVAVMLLCVAVSDKPSESHAGVPNEACPDS